MSIEVLGIIKDAMKEMNLPYAFMEYTADEDSLPNTYFVGEYQELEPLNEDGEEDAVFILTGFSREKWIQLEEAKEKIKKYFPKSTGKMAATDSNTVAAIFYTNSLPIPVENDELKKMQINLTVKEWKVEE